MSPLAFNGMSKQIKREPYLKQRVLLQAYYYRIAADLETNTRAGLPDLPTMDHFSGLKFSPDAERLASSQQKASRFSRFCRALYAVEGERLRQRESLQNELGIPELPVRMCDPDILPAMCGSVRGACDAFPKQVSTIAAQHGVSTADFTRLNDKVRKDLFFRLLVQKECNKIEREERSSRKPRYWADRVWKN